MNTTTNILPEATPATKAQPIIRLSNIEKYYQTKAGFTYVLRQIVLDIAEGEFVTIMGPSGAGKSTGRLQGTVNGGGHAVRLRSSGGSIEVKKL